MSMFLPEGGAEPFLRRAQLNSYSMEGELIAPILGGKVSKELEEGGLLVDMIEQADTDIFSMNRMTSTSILHRRLNDAVSAVEGHGMNHLPYFSVRVFEPGAPATTVHRNHPQIGPWAVGITIKGSAPFNTYPQDVLAKWETRPLIGTDQDPAPIDTMSAVAGSGWTLYTENELAPHSGGIVDSDSQRELLIFYGMRQ